MINMRMVQVSPNRLRVAAAIACAASLIAAASASASFARLDPGFGHHGVVISKFKSSANSLSEAIPLENGRLMIAEFGPKRSYRRVFDSKGQLDRRFGINGTLTIANATTHTHGAPTDADVQPDGKVLAVYPGGQVARLRKDGHLDRSFADDGIATVPAGAEALLLQPDGGIVVTGAGDRHGATLVLRRLLPNGEPDETFGEKDGQTLFYGVHWDAEVAMDNAGGIAAFGYGSRLHTRRPAEVVIRMDEDGHPDPAFASSPKEPGVVRTPATARDFTYGVLVDHADRVLTVTDRSVGGADRMRVRRYLPSGELDRSFGEHGLATDHNLNLSGWFSIVEASGGYWVAGTSGERVDDSIATGRIALLHIRQDGTLDRRIGSDGVLAAHAGAASWARSLVRLPAGKLVVQGYSIPTPTSRDRSVVLVRYDIR